MSILFGMKLSDVIEYFGGRHEDVAEALGISRAAVSMWVAAGEIPLLRQYQIEVLTKRRLRVADEHRQPKTPA